MSSRFRLSDGRIATVPDEELDAFSDLAAQRGDDFAQPIEDDEETQEESPIAAAPAPIAREPEAEMTVGEPTVIKSGKPLAEDPPAVEDEDWLQGLSGEERGELSNASAAWQRAAESPGRLAAALGGNILAPILAAGGFVGDAIQGGLDAYAGGASGKASVGAGAASGAVGGTLQGGSKLAGMAGDALQKSGLNHRVAATGVYGGQMKRMMQNMGPEAVQQLGRDIEAKGLHKGEGMLGWLPQPASTYADNSAALRDSAAKRLSETEDAIEGLTSPPTVPTGAIADDLERGALQSRGMWDPAGGQEAAFRKQYADAIRGGSNAVEAPGQPAQYMADWADAQAQRRYVDQQIDWNRLGGFEGAPMQEQVRREVAGNLRAGVKDSLDRGVEIGTVPGELRDAWRGANDDYRIAAAVNDPAIARVYQEYGNQAVSLPAWSAMGFGGNPVAGAAMGAAASFAKNRGHSALAGAQGALGRNAEAVSDAGSWLEKWAPTGAAIGQGAASGASAQGQDDLDAYGDLTRDEVTPSEAMGERRGFELGQGLDRVMDEKPELLRPYALQLSEAKDEADRQGIIERLVRTDDRFRKTVYPLIAGGR